MTIQHSSITDPNIHEPKGVNTAAANTAYLADGAGSGTWGKVPTQGLSGITGNGVANQVVAVTGAGEQSLVWPLALGAIYYVNIGSPTVITYPSSYTKVAVTSVTGGDPIEFTEGTNTRLTYTGTLARRGVILASVTLGQSVGADRDIRLSVYKNGVALANSETVATLVSGHKKEISVFIDTTLVTNDYLELFVRNDGASGDVSVYCVKLITQGLLT